MSPEFSCFSSIWLLYSASLHVTVSSRQRIIGATLRAQVTALGHSARASCGLGHPGITAGGDTQG